MFRCLNGGTCIDGIDNFTCSCPPRLTGVLCECLIFPNNTLDCTYIQLTITEYPVFSTTLMTTVPLKPVTESTTQTITYEVPTTPIEGMPTTPIEGIEVTKISDQTEKTQDLTYPTLPSSSSSYSELTTEGISSLPTSTIEQENFTIFAKESESSQSPRSFGSTTTMYPAETSTIMDFSSTTEFVHYITTPPSVISVTPQPVQTSSFTGISEIETQYITTSFYRNATSSISPIPTRGVTTKTSVATDTTSSTMAKETTISITSSESLNVTMKSSLPTETELLPTIFLATTFSTLEFETTTEESKIFGITTTSMAAIGSTTERVTLECGTDSVCKGGGTCTVGPEERNVSIFLNMFLKV